MIETKEKEINGVLYSVTQLPARRALRLQSKLVKLLGSSVANLFSEGSTNKDLLKAFPKAVTALSNQLDEKSFDNLVNELVEYNLRIDGKEFNIRDFDLFFSGKLNDLFLLLAFILQVNFMDFFLTGGILEGMLEAEESEEIIESKPELMPIC